MKEVAMRKITGRPSVNWLGALVVMGAVPPASAADGGTKTLIDYFQPTPIVCPLTSETWGAAGVLPRDTCNGLEDSTNKNWQYWDGKILQGPDGKYHLYAGQWPQNKGFADWPQSTIVEAVSNGTLMGSYITTAATPFAGKEQNVTGFVTPTGGYALLDSPGKLYTSPSLTDPWTSAGAIAITANGSTIATATTENQTIWQSADSSYLIIARNFQEMTSGKSIVGPYIIQATIPGLQSQGYEDPVVWCSGGQYHLVANMYNARKANHFTSADGIHNWVNNGVAYDPTTDFVRYTDGTVNHWYKMERPAVFLQNGHVTAFTFAVIDVDKTLDLANDTHGSKIIVVPFDGVSFDRDNPGPGSAACPIDSGGTGGTSGTAGTGGSSGDGGVGGSPGTGGTRSTGGSSGEGGTTGAGGSAQKGTGGNGAGASPGSGGGFPSTGSAGTSARGAGGSPPPSGQGGSTAESAVSGCSCGVSGSGSSRTLTAIALLVGVTLAIRRRRRW
jgi:MYXO-CTERM domain-containing protein